MKILLIAAFITFYNLMCDKGYAQKSTQGRQIQQQSYLHQDLPESISTVRSSASENIALRRVKER